jgi:hypothetical protein
MNPREQVFAALAGRPAGRVPFVIWDNKLPGGALDQHLLAAGVCVIVKSSVTRLQMPGVEVRQEQFAGADGQARIRRTYTTAAGELSTIHRPMPGTVWQEKHLFEGPQDYDALEAYLAAFRFEADFARFAIDDRRMDGQSLARPATLRCPLQEVAYELMGIETFAIEWAENRPRVLRLMELCAAHVEAQLDILARSPAQYVVIDGNTDVHTVGPERFEQYHLPHIDRCCRVLHAAGKFVGSHLDGDNRLLAPLIARTSLDFIESFTPPPDCDLSVADALAAWPGKTLVLNFPSSLHLGGVDKVRSAAAEILSQARGSSRLVFGVSEDVPPAARHTLLPLAKMVAEAPPQTTTQGTH